MELFVNLCGFLGVWLLFTFPFYQARLELATPTIELNQIVETKMKVEKISPFYWIIPPYKIYKEKQQAIFILKNLQLEKNKLYQIMNFFDKATAWFFVSLAGLLNGIYITHEIFEKYEIHNPYYFLILIVVMVATGILQVNYRMSKKRIDRKLSLIN
ncbi:hypothetical protein [Enterococcus pallens]|uniref:Uncharacterized protein n=1 Tax=Enterococcus pallens ATCC BAA-351 TaxID=1158607 RepID=R2PSS1_9ENTE|nr:hypothetical protein [Enterococcus pallens]EOH86348.1 hypothetical protein UAU_05270 [Enterococcus pallens ATCC BAA-351]EOU09431.1 hypothetical protein I588_05164 [Enterococcus pallens ATCC BAA-351]OJG77571.1 hypothetical protein RV10_GL002405 [Enterococcus pallens]